MSNQARPEVSPDGTAVTLAYAYRTNTWSWRFSQALGRAP
jgi:hypothetical protein